MVEITFASSPGTNVIEASFVPAIIFGAPASYTETSLLIQPVPPRVLNPVKLLQRFTIRGRGCRHATGYLLEVHWVIALVIHCSFAPTLQPVLSSFF